MIHSAVTLSEVTSQEKPAFLRVALEYFRELNSDFEPIDEWNNNYLDSVLSRQNHFMCWIKKDNDKIGFIKFGANPHYYRNQLTGNIYDFYVVKGQRRKGLAEQAVRLTVEKLRIIGVKKIELTVINGNSDAALFWQKLDFKKTGTSFKMTI